MIKENDIVLIRFADKVYIKRIKKGDSLNIKSHVLKYDDIIGLDYGIYINGFLINKPSIEEIIKYGFKRETQIVYPKDAFYAAFKINTPYIKNILEFGMGSAAMSSVLISIMKQDARLYTHEENQKAYNNAIKNLKTFGLLGEKLIPKLANYKDIDYSEGFFDGAFVDTKEPWEYVDKLHKELSYGAHICFLVPTYNQVSKLLETLKDKFFVYEISEILLRKLKPNPERLRPEDFMPAHTAIMIFAVNIKNVPAKTDT